MIDALLILVLGLVTWCVAGEGAFGAALNCIIIVISGLLAMNLFEPVATIGQAYILSSGYWMFRWDIISLVGLFAAFIVAFRFVFERMTPRYFHMEGTAHDLARWLFGLVAGYVTMAFLLTSLHTAPLPREFIGFRPERANLFDQLAPDRQWLGFTQYVSESVFADPIQPRIFDGPVEDFIDDPNNAERNKVWSSFPIRYATRRGNLDGSVAAVAAPVQQAAPVRTQPGGGGGGAAGF